MWAGNSGTPQGASNGTCGSGTPSNSLSNATYSNQYVYTHLGQLWQGPYNGSGSYQYLYCNSSQPHQLTGLYPTGTTCSTTSGKTQSYAASYDSWGNMTTRTASGAGGTTATLSYDGQDHLMRWNDTKTTSNEEWYMYDASGQRVLRRSQTGTGNSNTKYTITAFGLEDHIYDGGGNNLNNKYYYSLAGHLISVNTGSTNFLFTDALGSVVSNISNTANSASVKGNQVYGPYGNLLYSKGTLSTTKGYTGQYNDSLTQLDYYGARYYDPFVSVFLSADRKQGNMQGVNPYVYVGDNPETHNDPTGQFTSPLPVGGGGLPIAIGVGAVAAGAIIAGGELAQQAMGPLPNPNDKGYVSNLLPPPTDDPYSLDPYWIHLRQVIANGGEAAVQAHIFYVLQHANGLQWDDAHSVDELIAWFLSIRTYMSRGGSNRPNLADGYYWVTGPDGKLIGGANGFVTSSPVPGYSTTRDNSDPHQNDTHSEMTLAQGMINQIAVLQAKGLLPPGSTLNLVFFTQLDMCDKCKNDMLWLAEAITYAAGPGVHVRISGWETTYNNAVNAGTDPRSVYPGSTDEIRENFYYQSP